MTASVSPQDLAKAKLLHVYTMYKMGIRRLQDQAFDEAATQFDKALKHRPDSMSVERVRNTDPEPKIWPASPDESMS
jgi:outer membrane protein assembly factor BamD (BamD/ComL family)